MNYHRPSLNSIDSEEVLAQLIDKFSPKLLLLMERLSHVLFLMFAVAVLRILVHFDVFSIF